MKLKFLLFFIATLTFSNLVAANEATGEVNIVSIGNWVGNPNKPNEAIAIKTDQATITNPGNCPKTSAYILLDASDISKTLVLTALTTQRKIVLNIWGGCTSDGYPQITQVTLKR